MRSAEEHKRKKVCQVQQFNSLVSKICRTRVWLNVLLVSALQDVPISTAVMFMVLCVSQNML